MRFTTAQRMLSFVRRMPGVEEGKRSATWTDRTGAARRTIKANRAVSIFHSVHADMVAPVFYHRYLTPELGRTRFSIRAVPAIPTRDGTLVFAKRVCIQERRAMVLLGRCISRRNGFYVRNLKRWRRGCVRSGVRATHVPTTPGRYLSRPSCRRALAVGQRHSPTSRLRSNDAT